MTFVGCFCVLCVVTVITTAPQAGQRASFFISENGGAVDNSGGGWIVYWNFNHVDSEECGTSVTRGLVEAAVHFFLIPDAGGAGVINDDFSVFTGSCDDGMCM